jgi:biopolymer transport protein ExbD
MRPRKSPDDVKCEMQMTPMIDIVFQLLTFFIMTFNIVQAEGDLAIRMPVDKDEGPPAPTTAVDIPLRVVLTAGAGGNLAGVRVGDEPLADVQSLRTHFERLAARNPDSAESVQVDLICDDDLDYTHMLAALTAVSGKREAGKVVPLVKDVRIRKNGQTL